MTDVEQVEAAVCERDGAACSRCARHRFDKLRFGQDDTHRAKCYFTHPVRSVRLQPDFTGPPKGGHYGNVSFVYFFRPCAGPSWDQFSSDVS